jgi:hypothetical protein
MSKKSIVKIVFLWCEIIVSARILLFTIPLGGMDLAYYGGQMLRSPVVAILNVLAVLFIMAGVAGLQDKPGARFLHLFAGFLTLAVASIMFFGGAPWAVTADPLPLGLVLFALAVIYLFGIRSKVEIA